MGKDIFQERYLEHQERKAKALSSHDEDKDAKQNLNLTNALAMLDAIKARRSHRKFTEVGINSFKFEALMEAAVHAPSSCNRQAIGIKALHKKEEIQEVSESLVGGRGWSDKANLMLLLFADMRAYKSPAEVEFMPYLDAGHLSENILLTSEALSLGSCFINPNLVQDKKLNFNKKFGNENLKFCGAIALGNYAVKPNPPVKRDHLDILL